ncbi:MAG: hypothetical protein WB615_00035 [Candidatus Tumulicola sp.]
MKRFAILAIAVLTAACSTPLTQSTTPTMAQQGTSANGVAKPDGPCYFVKMEPPSKHIQTYQKIGIWEYLRWRSNGVCQSLLIPATWSSTGGQTHVKKNGRSLLFHAAHAGTYVVTATVYYNSTYYTGQSTIYVGSAP